MTKRSFLAKNDFLALRMLFALRNRGTLTRLKHLSDQDMFLETLLCLMKNDLIEVNDNDTILITKDGDKFVEDLVELLDI